MNKIKFLFCSVLTAGVVNAADIEQVIVRQQWPWSTDVKVEYKISQVTKPIDIIVTAYNGDEELKSETLAQSMRGDIYGVSRDGVGSIIIDPVKAFGTQNVVLSNFNVKLSLKDSVDGINEKLYKIIDLDSGKVTDVTRADFYNNRGYGTYETNYSVFGSGGWNTSLKDVLVWTGVTNDVYKTSKLVLRRIKVSDGAWTMGSNSDSTASPAHKVKLTEDYYIGVFEVTQEQMYRLTKSYGYAFTDVQGHERMPICQIRWDIQLGRPFDWPATSREETEMSRYGFFGELRAKTGNKILFDLPTEAEWEYACRAGTDTLYYTGRSDEHDRGLLAYRMNDGRDDAVGPSEVGKYLPNAFGLYDMYSNAHEWCLDCYGAYSSDASDGSSQVDPAGPVGSGDSPNRVARGGNWNTVYGAKTLATTLRLNLKPGTYNESNCAGCRVWCPAD